VEAAQSTGESPANFDFLSAFEDFSAAVEAGAGLPEIARRAATALGASVAIVDASSSVLAVACQSPDEERAVLTGSSGSQMLELRVADTAVGQLRYRIRGEVPPPSLVRMVGNVIGLEVERSRGPERASEAAVASFMADVLDRKVTDRENIVARAEELGCDLSEGGSIVVARAYPQRPEEGDWRARVLTIVERGARGAAPGALAASVVKRGRRVPGASPDGELVVVVPGGDSGLARRAAEAVLRELESSVPTFSRSVAISRVATDPADLYRAGAEALLAANVAVAQAQQILAFEETGAYRLLLPAMSEDPAELQRFYEETVAPLVEYDEQYETDLVHTLESFLDSDGNVARTAEKLFTHRHTVRYRLERVRDLTGLDVGSTDGRERLGLGLKAMRVLGIALPQGPATEPGSGAGRVRREGKDR
jgi:sugar diacid utilization regulator